MQVQQLIISTTKTEVVQEKTGGHLYTKGGGFQANNPW